jgi:hypothetical protein
MIPQVGTPHARILDEATNTHLARIKGDSTRGWIPALATTFYPGNRLKLDWHLDVGGKSLDVELADAAGYITLSPAAVGDA